MNIPDIFINHQSLASAAILDALPDCINDILENGKTFTMSGVNISVVLPDTNREATDIINSLHEYNVEFHANY